jgi:3-phenylpropionate/trans-cinnamate dioxygenase ferredoxin reductase subunit
VPWFWSDQHDARLQIAGLAHGATRQVLRRAPDGVGFSLFSFDRDRLVAVESINRPTDHVLGRKVLETGLPFTPQMAEDPALTVAKVLNHAA